MPDIYLHVEGQQTGPYSVEQVRQMVAEGRITSETPAWRQGMAEWGKAAQFLPAFAAETGTTPPMFVPPAGPAPVAKKGMHGCLLAFLIGCAVFFPAVGILAVLAGIALGPIQKGIEKAKENMSMQTSRSIAFGLQQYAVDHNGAYPDGKTSTEVFQKLIDGKYVADSSVFYIKGWPGKVPPTSDQLTADNVCFDVTGGVTDSSPGVLPVVFTTGYNVTYSGGVAATPDASNPSLFPGMAVTYKSNNAHFWMAQPDRSVVIIPPAFDPGSATYRQLKP